jgi:hypothetical protein
LQIGLRNQFGKVGILGSQFSFFTVSQVVVQSAVNHALRNGGHKFESPSPYPCVDMSKKKKKISFLTGIRDSSKKCFSLCWAKGLPNYRPLILSTAHLTELIFDETQKPSNGECILGRNSTF